MGKKIVDEVTEIMDREPEELPPPIHPDDALSTGSTLLNLAMSGMPEGGLFPKHYYLWWGDSGSGKSKLTMTAFAEAVRNPRYDDHDLIHDNVENGTQMDYAEHFGKRVYDRIRPPSGTRAEPVYSSTTEEFYFNLDNAFKRGPFIYVLDSMDGLDTEDDQQTFRKRKNAHARDKLDEASGSYGTAKARQNSSGLRGVMAKLFRSDSILIVISHAKMTIGQKSRFQPRSRSGGTSLKFFAHVELLTSVVGPLKKRVRGKDRIVGINVAVKVEKNRQTGQEGKLLEIPIYRDRLGIDDVASCVDFLIEEGHWKENDKKKIIAREFTPKPVDRDELIVSIENEDMEPDLRKLVTSVWKEIEEESRPGRKHRYE